MKTANSTKKTAAVVEAYLGSFKARKSIEAPALIFAGILVFRRMLETVHKTRQSTAMIRIAQGKPILGVVKRIIRGKITPPIPPAVHAIPVA
jgi:hypothetical protein